MLRLRIESTSAIGFAAAALVVGLMLLAQPAAAQTIVTTPAAPDNDNAVCNTTAGLGFDGDGNCANGGSSPITALNFTGGADINMTGTGADPVSLNINSNAQINVNGNNTNGGTINIFQTTSGFDNGIVDIQIGPNGDMIVSDDGDVTFNTGTTLTMNGTAEFTMGASTTFTNAGTTNLNGPTNVSGVATFTNTTNLNGTTNVNGAATFNSTATFNGTTTLAGTTNVTGPATFTGGVDMGGNRVQNVGDPIAPMDAANMRYVDQQIGFVSTNLDAVRRQTDDNTKGIAMAMAMGGGADLRNGETVALSVDYGTFDGESAGAVSGIALLGSLGTTGAHVYGKGSVGFAGSDSFGGRAGIQFGW
jgi:trimeric autotransporter adhesin